MKTLKALLILFLSSTAAQAASYNNAIEFTDGKSGYEVEVAHLGGRMILDGRHPETGKTFHLVVSSKGQVTGEWEGRAVDYMLSSRSALRELAQYRAGR